MSMVWLVFLHFSQYFLLRPTSFGMGKVPCGSRWYFGGTSKHNGILGWRNGTHTKKISFMLHYHRKTLHRGMHGIYHHDLRSNLRIKSVNSRRKWMTIIFAFSLKLNKKTTRIRTRTGARKNTPIHFYFFP